MAGITGFCQNKGTALPVQAQGWLESMYETLACPLSDIKVPDTVASCIDGPVAFACRQAEQAVVAHAVAGDAHCYAVLDGEFYNAEEICEALQIAPCDNAAVLLQAWLAWGQDALTRIEGVFAFALWDGRDKTLVCGRDRFGVRPFFYTMQGHCCVFASELKALTRFPGLRLSVRRESIMRYLAYEYVPTPDCIYQEVSKLPPAHLLFVRDGHTRLVRWWDMPWPEPVQPHNASEDELSAELCRLLDVAVQRRMKARTTVGAYLSGGIDSSVVVGLMARHCPRVRTFSIGFTEKSYDESHYARIVAEHYATEHRVRVLSAQDCAVLLPRIIPHLDEPMADASLAPTYLASQFLREHVGVALGGDGADEILAGYEHYIAFALAEVYNKLPAWVRTRCLEPLARLLPASTGYVNLRLAAQTFLAGAATAPSLRVQALLTACTPEIQQTLWRDPDMSFLADAQLFEPTRQAYAHWPESSGASPLARAFHVYVRQGLLDDNLVKVTRATALCGLTARAPFMDTDVVNFVTRLPIHYKLRGLQRKYILKKACADILPRAILTRNKRGFQIPVAEWLRGELRPLVEELCGETFVREQGFFDTTALRGLIDAHMHGQADHRKALWTLLVLQLWWREHKPVVAG